MVFCVQSMCAHSEDREKDGESATAMSVCVTQTLSHQQDLYLQSEMH